MKGTAVLLHQHRIIILEDIEKDDYKGKEDEYIILWNTADIDWEYGY